LPLTPDPLPGPYAPYSNSEHTFLSLAPKSQDNDRTSISNERPRSPRHINDKFAFEVVIAREVIRQQARRGPDKGELDGSFPCLFFPGRDIKVTREKYLRTESAHRDANWAALAEH
jgi:hypothetical protein